MFTKNEPSKPILQHIYSLASQLSNGTNIICTRKPISGLSIPSVLQPLMTDNPSVVLSVGIDHIKFELSKLLHYDYPLADIDIPLKQIQWNAHLDFKKYIKDAHNSLFCVNYSPSYDSINKFNHIQLKGFRSFYKSDTFTYINSY